MMLPARTRRGAAAGLAVLCLWSMALVLTGTIRLVPAEEAARLVSAPRGAAGETQSGEQERGKSSHEAEFTQGSRKIKGEVENG